jgi:hypothetical protein
MLSAILRSNVAIKMSIQIIQAFVQMRSLLKSYDDLYLRIESVEIRQEKTENKMTEVFELM